MHDIVGKCVEHKLLVVNVFADRELLRGGQGEKEGTATQCSHFGYQWDKCGDS